MRLVQLYSNKPSIFERVPFRHGLNVVLGRITRPENLDKDTHNLGKTLLAQLIDFCLLRGKSSDFFLFRHRDRFEDFVFFLELELNSGAYVTVRRAVEPGTKASFLRHDESPEDFSTIPEDAWDHWDVPFARSKQLLDGYLGLDAVRPWSFRKAIGYSLRTQLDYAEPFTLAKYGPRHVEWKPYLAHVLGLDWSLVKENYELKARREGLEAESARLRVSLDKTAEDRDQLRGRIAIQRRALADLSRQLDEYNFHLADAEINEELVDRLDTQIAQLNEDRYRLISDKHRIEQAIAERIVFDLKKVKKIFEEAEVYFGEQLTEDYEQLLSFNRAISDERDTYLKQELEEIEARLGPLNDELEQLNRTRATALEALRDRDTFSKYKKLSRRLVEQQTELELRERMLAAFDALEAIAADVRVIKQREQEVQEGIAKNLASEPARYTSIRAAFDRIVTTVINRHSNLYCTTNQSGNLEFKAEIIDDEGRATGATRGFTYGRILCIAFDLAVQLAYLDDAYPHFVYHDGFLETLDDRKKLNLIAAARDIADEGVQHIVTVIDSELPHFRDGERFEFDRDEVVLVLHDDGDEGRLFKMPPW